MDATFFCPNISLVIDLSECHNLEKIRNIFCICSYRPVWPTTTGGCNLNSKTTMANKKQNMAVILIDDQYICSVINNTYDLVLKRHYFYGQQCSGM